MISSKLRQVISVSCHGQNCSLCTNVYFVLCVTWIHTAHVTVFHCYVFCLSLIVFYKKKCSCGLMLVVVNSNGSERKSFMCSVHSVVSISQITRAHSFPRKFLPNSAGLFAKFHSLPWQNRLNFAAHHGLPFVSKLSSFLFRNFTF